MQIGKLQWKVVTCSKKKSADRGSRQIATVSCPVLLKAYLDMVAKNSVEVRHPEAIVFSNKKIKEKLRNNLRYFSTQSLTKGYQIF